MSYDFKAMHAAIKTVIDAADFDYCSLENWGSFADQNYPDAMKNRSYAIMLPGMGASNDSSANSALLNVSVEFVMDTANDLYLEVLGAAVTAIGNLSGIAVSTLCGVQDNGDLTDFTSILIPRDDAALGAMVVQFSNIMIDIEV